LSLMKLNGVFLLMVGVLTALSGCSSNSVNKNIYKALIQRECIQNTGEPNCDSGQPSYEDYQRERDEIKNQE
jgi:uncharacterized lipoprotein YmbA